MAVEAQQRPATTGAALPRGVRKLRVAHLTSVHPATDGRILRECRALQAAGHDVTIVGMHDGTDAAGVPIYALSKPRSRAARWTRTIASVFRAARELDADVYHFHDPELIFVGLALGRMGKPVIYDVHEDLPNQILSKDWIPPWLRAPVSQAAALMNRFASRGFSGMVAAWPNILETLSHPRVALVQNLPDAQEFAIAPDDFVPFVHRENCVLYCGALMETRGVREMIAAMQRPQIPDGARLEMGGVFDDPALEAEARSAKRVHVLGWTARPAYRALLRSVKAGLSLAHPTPAYRETLSTKVFEYLSAGVPAIISDFPRWRKVIDEYGCGIAVNPLDVDQIADAIAYLLGHPAEAEAMGRRGRQAVVERYNWDAEASRLRALYESVCR